MSNKITDMDLYSVTEIRQAFSVAHIFINLTPTINIQQNSLTKFRISS